MLDLATKRDAMHSQKARATDAAQLGGRRHPSIPSIFPGGARADLPACLSARQPAGRGKGRVSRRVSSFWTRACALPSPFCPELEELGLVGYRPPGVSFSVSGFGRHEHAELGVRLPVAAQPAPSSVVEWKCGQTPRRSGRSVFSLAGSPACTAPAGRLPWDLHLLILFRRPTAGGSTARCLSGRHISKQARRERGSRCVTRACGVACAVALRARRLPALAVLYTHFATG